MKDEATKAADTTDAAPPIKDPLYSRFANYYDLVFERVYAARIHQAIRSLEIPAGAEVLEVGVGTGVSLPAYPEEIRLTAIDLSPEMLAQANQRAAPRSAEAGG